MLSWRAVFTYAVELAVLARECTLGRTVAVSCWKTCMRRGFMFCPLLVASADVCYILVTSAGYCSLTRSVHKHLWLLIQPCKTLPNHNKNSESPRDGSLPASDCLNSSRFFKCHFCGTFTTFTAYVLTQCGLTLVSSWKKQARYSAPQTLAACLEGLCSHASSLLCSGLILLPWACSEWRNHSAGVRCFPQSRVSACLLVCISQIITKTGHAKGTCKVIIALYARL